MGRQFETESGQPDALIKRNLVFGSKVPDDVNLAEIAGAYAAEGRLCEAFDFYERANVPEGVATIKKRAIGDGDYFLLARLANGYPDRVETSDWEQLGDAAKDAEMLHYAVKAFERAESSDKLEAARAKLEEFQPSGEAKLAPGSIQEQTAPDGSGRITVEQRLGET